VIEFRRANVGRGQKEIELELGHVLFIDIVGYSKLLISEQRAFLKTLNQIVRDTSNFAKRKRLDAC
jgi:hypothetical protein